MAVTQVGPTVYGRMWGWEGSEVRGRGYFISPPQLPHPLHQQQQYTGCVAEHFGSALGAIPLQEEAQGPGLLAWLPPPPLASTSQQLSQHIGMHAPDIHIV